MRIQSYGELHERLFERTYSEELGRFRGTFAYRGEGRANRRLATSLSRMGDPARELEGHMLRNFRKYAHREAVHGDSVWSWLAVAQHHGLPTRLLDWSYSPYVALHFATENLADMATDSVVWRVDFARTNQLLPPVLKEVVASDGAFAFTAEMLSAAASSLAAFDSLAEHPFVLFFEPPSLDDRIVNQFALFSLLSDPTIAMDAWLEDRSDCAEKLVIPAEMKWEIRDKLDQANITERVLFPGLDGLARWLTRYYTARAR